MPGRIPARSTRSGQDTTQTQEFPMREPLEDVADYIHIAPGLEKAAARWRYLFRHGFTKAEAADITAFTEGLPVAGGIHWKAEEITKLLFFRELDRLGRMPH